MEESKQIAQRRSLLKYTALFGSVSVINMCSSLIRNKFTALFLGPSGVGILSIYNTFILFLSQLTNLGLSHGGVTYLADSTQDREKIIQRVYTFRKWIAFVSLFGVLFPILCIPFLDMLSIPHQGSLFTTALLIGLNVGLISFYAGEQVVLKSFRMLQKLGQISVLTTFASILIVIPLYYFFRVQAILWVFLLINLTQAFLSVRESHRLFPYSLRQMQDSSWKAGDRLLHIGGSIVLAGIVSTGVEYVLRQMIQNEVSPQAVGWYNAAFMLVSTYMGLVLSSIDQDFYARLSQLKNDTLRRDQLINDQIHIAFLILAPLLIGMMVFIPLIIPLLYSAEFIPSQQLVLLASLFVFIKPLLLPISYVALVLGDLKRYLLMDLVASGLLLGCSIWGIDRWGIAGVAGALSISAFLELLVIGTHTLVHYRLKLKRHLIYDVLLMLLLYLATLFLTMSISGWLYWIVGVLMTVFVGVYALFRLNRITNFFSSKRK